MRIRGNVDKSFVCRFNCQEAFSALAQPGPLRGLDPRSPLTYGNSENGHTHLGTMLCLEDSLLPLQAAECSNVRYRKREEVLVLVADSQVELAQLETKTAAIGVV